MANMKSISAQQSPAQGDRSHGVLRHHHVHGETHSRDAGLIAHTAASGFIASAGGGLR